MRPRPHPATTPLLVLAALTACSDGDAAKRSPRKPVVDSVSQAAPEAGKDDLFRNVLAGSGIDHRHLLADGAMDCLPESVGSGVTVFDYDGDGLLDLYFVLQGWDDDICEGERVADGGTNRLYRNLGNMRFEDVTVRAGVGDPGYGYMALAADLDDDGDADLYVLNDGPNVLYRNRGDGTFEDATDAAGVAGDASSVGGALLDADGDGRLDIYVGNYVMFDGSYRLRYAPDVFPGPLAFEPHADILYLNQGGGRFRDATQGSGLEVVPARAMGVSVFDYDGDGRLDLYVANDATANFLFHNEGGGKFTECALRCGVAFGVQGEATAAMAGAVGDIDDDGRPDLHVTDAAYGSLFHNRGDGVFQDRIVASGIAAPSGQWASWGGGFLDYDLDGHADLYLANGDLHRATGRPDLLFHGGGDGTFQDVSYESGAWFLAERMGRGAALADLDSDGRMDVIVTHIADRPALLRNTTPPAGHHVIVALHAKPGDANGIGAKVTVTAGGRTRSQIAMPVWGYLTQGDPRLCFALGDVEVLDSLAVVWPDGERQEASGLAVDRVVTATQGGTIQ